MTDMCFRALLVSFYCCFGAIALVGQNSSYLISELKRELFPVRTELTPLYSYIAAACPNMSSLVSDSSVYIRSPQPDYDKVIGLLEKIYWDHDTATASALLEIYQNQMKVFNKEFLSIFYSTYRKCEIVTKQYAVLTAFERILLSFELSRLSDYEVFEYIVSNTFLMDSFMRASDQLEISKLINPIPVYSEDYRQLRAKAWFSTELPYKAVSYHLKRTESYFVSYFENYNWAEKPNKRIPVFIWKWKEHYLTISNTRITKSLIKNYQYWKDHGINTFHYHYVNKHYDSELLNLVFDDWLSLTYANQPGLSIKDLFTSVLLTGKSAEYIPELLVKASISRPEVVNEQLKYFPAQYQLEKRLADYQGPRSEKVAARKLLKSLRKQRAE